MDIKEFQIQQDYQIVITYTNGEKDFLICQFF